MAKSSAEGPHSSARVSPSGISSLQARVGAWSVGWTHQSTLPYAVDTMPALPVCPSAIAQAAGAGSSLAAARPGGYRDGTEDATTVPSAATATTAVTAWSLCPGPVIAGTSSVPPWPGRAMPGWGGWPGSPSTIPVRTPPEPGWENRWA
jgi:hypothetical protein